jgi:hypothetical protein
MKFEKKLLALAKSQKVLGSSQKENIFLNQAKAFLFYSTVIH